MLSLSPRARRRLAIYFATLLLITGQPLLAQNAPSGEDALPLAEISLPSDLAAAPAIAPGEPGQYVLEFNRSPVVGNRLRFNGIYDEQRLYFTRPRNWEPQSVKVLLRYRHSAALYATRSNLTVLVNGTITTAATTASQNSTAANQVADAFTELRSVAQALQEEVGRFKVS